MTIIAFRVDASAQMGTGHLFRCLTLADAIKKDGIQTHFLCRELEGFDSSLITSRGHNVQIISTLKEESIATTVIHALPHSHWLPCSQHQDYTDCIDVLNAIAPLSWIIVDHYALDSHWEVLASKHTKHLMVIDDLADRTHICDVLLDQNCYSDMFVRYTSLIPEYCKPLLGPHYSLLRPEFIKERNKIRRQQSKISRIFIFFGGSDLTNETQKTLDFIELLNRPDIVVDVVVGSSNPHSESILEKALKMKQVNTYHYINNMATTMSQADLVIGAGGSSNWERFCLGIPSIVIGIAQNQIGSCEYLAKKSLIIYLGYHTYVTSQTIHDMFLHLEKNSYILKEIADNSKRLVDGRGVTRVLKELW